jgi:hypothetical protein
MAQLGRQMIFGACEGFANHFIKLVLLAYSNRYEEDPNKFFPSGNALYPFKNLPVSTLACFDTSLNM